MTTLRKCLAYVMPVLVALAILFALSVILKSGGAMSQFNEAYQVCRDHGGIKQLYDAPRNYFDTLCNDGIRIKKKIK